MSRRTLFRNIGWLTVFTLAFPASASSLNRDTALILDGCPLRWLVEQSTESGVPLPMHCQTTEDGIPFPTGDPKSLMHAQTLIIASPAPAVGGIQRNNGYPAGRAISPSPTPNP